jgi:hypothetical protein
MGKKYLPIAGAVQEILHNQHLVARRHASPLYLEKSFKLVKESSGIVAFVDITMLT